MIHRLKKHLRYFSSISLILVMAFSVFSDFANGGQIPSAQVSLSDHTISTAANHTYKFQTPSGIDSPTDTITIDLSSWTVGLTDHTDIDIFYGPATGLENTTSVAALPAVNTWGAAFSGGVLTLTPPSNSAPGSIPAGNYITVRIGTNAAGGDASLTNPATAGSYSITIGGGFGDMALLAQAIMNSNSVSVSGQVGPSLQITNLNPSSVVEGTGGFTMIITGSGFVSSTITQLDGNTRPTVFVSSTEVLATILASDINAQGTRQITVHNPIPAITSNQLPLTVTSQGGGGPSQDTTPPTIINPQVINITQTTARVIWDTDEAADSLVEYGLTSSYTDSVSNSALVLSHGIDLTNLTPSTTYHFRVQSSDQYGNTSVSVDYTFTTLPWPPLEIANVTSTNITDNSAIIVWDTNRPADSRVEYGLTSG
ncbi:hypothetical protein GF391_00425, partial [Candidatus Uhrbacteria bacterium]|nr:hypothetical protein [Candidatus Uhrbacteria bacterium]